MAEFKDRLQMAMENAGVSQADICKECDISRPTISGYLSGARQPGAFIASKMANMLGVTVQWLMLGDDPMNKVSVQPKELEEPDEVLKQQQYISHRVLEILRGVKCAERCEIIIKVEPHCAPEIHYEVKEGVAV